MKKPVARRIELALADLHARQAKREARRAANRPRMRLYSADYYHTVTKALGGKTHWKTKSTHA